MKETSGRKVSKPYVIVGAIIGAAIGVSYTDTVLGAFSVVVYAVVGATIGAGASYLGGRKG